MSHRECVRCEGSTRAGAQCSRRTRVTAARCWQHSRAETGFAVKPSGLAGAGRGLFANRDMPKGARVLYAGPAQRMTRSEVEKRWPGDTLAPYVFCSGNVCWNAASTQSGLGRYANDGPRSGKAANAVIRADGASRQRAYVVLTKPVKRGREIFVTYGAGYWGGGGKGG